MGVVVVWGVAGTDTNASREKKNRRSDFRSPIIRQTSVTIDENIGNKIGIPIIIFYLSKSSIGFAKSDSSKYRIIGEYLETHQSQTHTNKTPNNII